jgi:hypothetical protein
LVWIQIITDTEAAHITNGNMFSKVDRFPMFSKMDRFPDRFWPVWLQQLPSHFSSGIFESTPASIL